MAQVVALILLALVSGCATFALRTDRCPSLPLVSAPSVMVQYLGSGGYLVQRGKDVVLFGPVYTNPGLPEVVFDHEIRTDEELVDELLPAEAADASAIVIGHSHYDHAMDTPYIATVHAKWATVYGSATLKHLIGSVVSVIDVAYAADAKTFLPINSRLRLWPIRSKHSDQSRLEFAGVNLPLHLWRGKVTAPRAQLPTTASGWAEGEVYAYVLDFMGDGGQVDFRLYYQDSGTHEPVGYPVHIPPRPHGRGFDLVMLCVGGDFTHLRNHPAGILKATQPRFVLLGHWEDFFRPQTDHDVIGKVSAIPRLNVNEFRRAAGRDAILPCPTESVFHFPLDPSHDGMLRVQ